MSTIGSPTVASLGLAASIVGSSRPEAAVDQNIAAAAEQKAIVDRAELSANTLEDVSNSEFGSDRDADGRQLYRRSDSNSNPATGETPSSQAPLTPRPEDAFGDSGNALDMDA
jgi:hypothetical protein